MTLVAAIAVAGCPGKTTVVGPDPEPGPGDVVALDQSFVDYEEVELVGATFAPTALGRPGMIRVTSKSRTTLARQRKKASRRNAKPDDVHVLASMLWADSDKLDVAADPDRVYEGSDIQRSLRQEALDALRGLYTRLGDGKASAVTLQMLASATVWAQDWTAAEAAYKELIARFPTHADRVSFEMWLAVLYLRRGRFTDALEAVDGWQLGSTDALAAYTLSWVRFIKGDDDIARAAILRAAATWTSAGRRAVANDLLLILARSGADVETATEAVRRFTADRPKRRARLLNRLSNEYQKAGRYREASEVLDSIMADTGQQPPAAKSVEQRLRQAEFQFLLGDPMKSSELAIAAHESLATCSDCNDALSKRVDERVTQFAVFFHNTYHDCLDASYYDAAEKLYTHLMQAPGGDADARRGNLANLKDARDRANPADGKHNAEVLYKLAVARSETVRACYESVLLGNRVLDGSLVLRIEIDNTGAVTGAATDPAEGLEGMAQVAGCVLEQVREWKFPSRTVPGTTTMSIPFLLRRPGG